MSGASFVHPLLALACAPLLPGVIARAKALVAGRVGPPLSQPYRDLARLARKGAVYSPTTGWHFRALPIGTTAALATALLLVPMGGVHAPLAFTGDLLLVAALLGAVRFVTILGALDTGSSFEGLGASREAAFGALAEPALLLALAAIARATSSDSLSTMIARIDAATWIHAGPALVLVLGALAAVLLTENARIPVDDPATHLELTMIHEVMVLDHSGPDLALVHYGAALKLWLFGAILVGVAVPVRAEPLALNVAAFLAGMLGLAAAIGLVESTMARLRLFRVPQFLVGAAAFAALAWILLAR